MPNGAVSAQDENVHGGKTRFRMHLRAYRNVRHTWNRGVNFRLPNETDTLVMHIGISPTVSIRTEKTPKIVLFESNDANIDLIYRITSLILSAENFSTRK